MIRRNILSGLLGQGMIMLLTLISTRLVFRELGSDVLGVIYFAMTVTSLVITLSDMGVSHTITREVAAHREKDSDYVSALMGTASSLAWGAYLFLSAVVIVAAPMLITRWLQTATVEPATVLSFQIISSSLLLAIPRTLYGSMISGYERLDLFNIANIFAMGIQQAGLIAVLGMGGRLNHVAMWYAISGIAGVVLYATIIGRLGGFRALRMTYQWQVIKKNIRFGSHLFINSMAGYFLYQIDRWTVSKFLPVRILGYYGVAQSLSSKCGVVPGAVASAAFPALSMGVENRRPEEWRGQYNKLQDFCSYVITPVSAAAAMLGIVIMGLVFNDEVMKAAWLPLIFLSIGQLFLGLQYVPYILAISMKKPELSLRANLRALIIVIPLSILLTINYGLPGAALTTAVAGATHMIFFIHRFSAECLQDTPWSWYRVSGSFVILGMISYGLPWAVLGLFGLGLNLYGLIAAYVVGTILFLVKGWFVIGQELKHVISEYLLKLGIQTVKETV